jgi:uncharacterized Tic20 family protein
VTDPENESEPPDHGRRPPSDPDGPATSDAPAWSPYGGAPPPPPGPGYSGPPPGYSGPPPAYASPPPGYTGPPPGYSGPPPGYSGPPPGSGGPPPGGYYGYYGPPPPYGPGITGPDDTTWALLGYLGQFLIGFLAPLIVYLARKDQSPFVRFHGAQALDLALTYLIVFFGAIVIAITGGAARMPAVSIVAILIMIVFAIVHLVYLIVGAVKAGRREMYRIPTWLCWRMLGSSTS